MAAKKSAKKSAKKAAKKAAAPKRSAKKAPAKKSAKRSAARKKVSRPSVVHWEIQAKDPKRLHDFYSELFGWAIDAANPMNYGMVSSGGKEAINGGIGGVVSRGGVVVYADVPDINATLARVAELGGKTIVPRTEMGPVILAIFEDAEGNHFGIIEG